MSEEIVHARECIPDSDSREDLQKALHHASEVIERQEADIENLLGACVLPKCPACAEKDARIKELKALACTAPNCDALEDAMRLLAEKGERIAELEEALRLSLSTCVCSMCQPCARCFEKHERAMASWTKEKP